MQDNVKKIPEKNDSIEIPLGKWMTGVRKNPWMLSTFVLAILLVGALAFGVKGNSFSADQDKVAADVISFLNQQVDGQGEVTLEDISAQDYGYTVNVNYMGDTIPIQVTSDGKYIMSDLVAIDGSGSVNEGSTNNEPVEANIPADAYVEGSDSAKVTIIEFSDFQCPFCEQFFTQTYSQLKKDYVDTGKVKFAYLHFPLSFHPEAQKAAEAAECAGEQGKFWEMHDKLFENQAELSTANYKLWAKQLGLDSTKFDTCLDSGKTADKVKSQAKYGESLGVTGTPGFFINGVPLSGAQPYSVFKQVIDAELAK